MQFHTLKRVHKNKKRTIVGRGGKRGKTSGRGTKGQKARAGRKIRPEMRDMIKRLPKLRGRGKNIFKSFAIPAKVIGLDLIEKNFSNGDTISPTSLREKNLVSGLNGRSLRIKILGAENFSKKVTVVDCTVSANARLMVEKAGGKIM
ncbi:MAG TPA: uL15 family ribosomal protein [Candidatus Paceibacterota bacterium]